MIRHTRRSFLGTGLAASVLTGIPAVQAVADDTPPTDTGDPDILFHSSFEDPTDQGWVTDSSDYDATESFAGDYSLKYTRTSRDSYTVVRRAITEFDPAIPWVMSVWMKSTEINQNPSYGARIALEAYDDTGKWLTAATSVAMVSADWVQMTTPVFDYIPENTDHLMVALYIYENQVGTAWFDEVLVRKHVPDLMNTSLNYPSYRGLMIPGETAEISLTSTFTMDLLSGDETAVVRLTGPSGDTVDTQTIPVAPQVDYTYPSDGLPPGKYTLTIELSNSDSGEPIAASEWPVTKISTVPATYIDEHGRLIRDGEPHFPIGFYTSKVVGEDADEKSLDDLADTPFNTLLAYRPASRDELDQARDQGIDIIYSFKDHYFDAKGSYKPPEIESVEDEVPVITEAINEFKDHPAVLAWYMSDELPIGHYAERMIDHYHAVTANDPDHPAYTVSPTVEDGEVYQRATDIFGADKYPIFGLPDDDIATVGERAEIAQTRLPGRGLVHVVQYFNWKYYGRSAGVFPSKDQLRSMCWQYLTLGARGLLLYQLPLMHRDQDHEFAALMATASEVATEILTHVPLLMAVDEPGEVIGSVAAARWTTRRSEGVDHVIVVSTSDVPQSVEFTHAGAAAVEVVGQDRTLTVDPNGTFTDDLPSLDVAIYRIIAPTYESLRDDTAGAFEVLASAGYRGVTRAAVQKLRAAERAARNNDKAEEESLLQDYRDFLAEQTPARLRSEATQRLTRLSMAIHS